MKGRGERRMEGKEGEGRGGEEGKEGSEEGLLFPLTWAPLGIFV